MSNHSSHLSIHLLNCVTQTQRNMYADYYSQLNKTPSLAELAMRQQYEAATTRLAQSRPETNFLQNYQRAAVSLGQTQ